MRSLSAKLIALLVTVMAGIFAVLGYLNIRLHRQHLEQATLAAAERVSDVIKRSSSYSMLHNDRDGLYRVTAADLGEPDAADSGSGVLARLTLEALLPGIHAISVDAIDLDEDGKPDIGPTLTDDSGDHPGDSNSDGFFDGAISNAKVAVDRDCADGGSAGTLSESDSGVGGSGTPWWIAAPIGAAVAAALVIGGFVARAVLRRRPSQA